MDAYTALLSYRDAVDAAERARGLPPGSALGEAWLGIAAAIEAGMPVDVELTARRAAMLVAVETREPVTRAHRGHSVGSALTEAGGRWIADPQADPLEVLILHEADRAREDLEGDHDDRPSVAAQRCARGLPPVEPTSRSSRSARRDRARARAMRRDGVMQYRLPGVAALDVDAGVAA